MKNWFVYILECSDGTLYTGITDDLESRLAAHNAGKGARYTKGKGPVILRHEEKVVGRSEASKREIEIKRLSRKEKQLLFSIRLR